MMCVPPFHRLVTPFSSQGTSHPLSVPSLLLASGLWLSLTPAWANETATPAVTETSPIEHTQATVSNEVTLPEAQESAFPKPLTTKGKPKKPAPIQAKAVHWRETTQSEPNPTPIQFQNDFPDSAWWLRFEDPYLSQYIQAATANNLPLAVAQARLQEARALARLSLGQEFPQLSIGPSFARQRNSATIIRSIRPGGTSNNSGSTTSSSTSSATTASSGTTGASGVSSSQASGFALGQAINYYTLPLNASYELDIWRKNRDRTRAANRSADALQQTMHSMHVMVASDVASAYFNLLAADQLIQLQKELIATANEDVQSAQAKLEAGVIDAEDWALRQGRLATFKAQLQDFYQLQALSLNQLAILMGKTPYQVNELARSSWERYPLPQTVEAGIPSEMITRRPDILAAEAQMQAAGFQVQYARKMLLPALNLNGQFGFSTATLKHLFKWDSYVASVGSSLFQGIYTGGVGRANLRVNQARYQQQLLNYQQTILQAFREVDDSLASLKAHEQAYQNNAASLATLRQRETIQENRLAEGVIAGNDLNSIHIEALQAQTGLVRNKLSTLTDVVSLYKALGGGY